MDDKKPYFTVILFTVYLFALLWIILLKMEFSFSSLSYIKEINLIPFSGSVIVNGEIYFSEIWNNILIFLPFGLYISMLKSEWSFFKKIASIFLASLFLEILQFIFAIGASDITDLISNTLGGAIGIGIYSLALNILKDKTLNVLNIIALIGTVFVFVFFSLLLIVN